MRIYISIDMEGIWGIASPKHVLPEDPNYERARRLMEDELNIILNILSKKLERAYVLVNDAHYSMDNLRAERILSEHNLEVELVSGTPKKLYMVEGIEKGFDTAFFIGYHSRAGTVHGLMDHTFSSRAFRKVMLNGRAISEAYMNALICSSFKVPISLVSGDDKLKRELEDVLDGTSFVVSKFSLSRSSARMVSRRKLVSAYEQAIEQALKEGGSLLDVPGSFSFRIELRDTHMADRCEIVPFVSRIDAYTVAFESEDVVEALGMLRTVAMVSSC